MSNTSRRLQQPQAGLLDHVTASESFTVPDVSDLPSDLIELAGEPYMRRYFVLGDNHTNGPTARFHQIMRSDGQDLHDHPWDFVSVLLSGSYIETTPDGEQQYGPGSVLIRTAEQLHRLTLVNGPVWTYITLSPPRRRWGFQTDAGWVHWRDYQNHAREW